MVLLRWTIFNLDYPLHFLALHQSSSRAIGKDRCRVTAYAGAPHASNQTILPTCPANFHLATVLLQCSVCFFHDAQNFCVRHSSSSDRRASIADLENHMLTLDSFIPAEYRPHIWVKVLPALENIFYGANLSNILSAHQHAVLDVMAWLQYGILHFGGPFIWAALMFLFGPPGNCACLCANIRISQYYWCSYPAAVSLFATLVREQIRSCTSKLLHGGVTCRTC